ncbi:Chitinase 4 [Linum perenne]
MEQPQQLLIATTIAAMLVAITTTVVVVVDAAVADIVTQDFWNSIHDKAGNDCAGKSFYTRDAFLQATGSYTEFGNSVSDPDSKREIAAFFAHITQETGSMCYVEEINRAVYCEASAQNPCAPGKRYYGRGPLQLTWNFNYKVCGDANNFDGVNNPDIVARDPVLTWKTALWFWMENGHPVLSQGFGETIRKINGIECTAAVQNLVMYYNSYCQRFGIPTEPNARCTITTPDSYVYIYRLWP